MRRRNVRYWHLAGISIAPGDVCFRGKSGHGDCAAKCLLMTQSGHDSDQPLPNKFWQKNAVGRTIGCLIQVNDSSTVFSFMSHGTAIDCDRALAFR